MQLLTSEILRFPFSGKPSTSIGPRLELRRGMLARTAPEGPTACGAMQEHDKCGSSAKNAQRTPSMHEQQWVCDALTGGAHGQVGCLGRRLLLVGRDIHEALPRVVALTTAEDKQRPDNVCCGPRKTVG